MESRDAYGKSRRAIYKSRCRFIRIICAFMLQLMQSLKNNSQQRYNFIVSTASPIRI